MEPDIDTRNTTAAFDSVESAVDDPSATVVELDGITREYGAETAVDDLSLSVNDGELLTLLGPSGCGKTTTLRMIAGLERPSGGSIQIEERAVADGSTFRKPEERNVGIVFQDYALFPHLNVAENIAFGLRDADSREADERVTELLELVDLTDHREKMPSKLSGGQQQRVALARSLAPEPDVLLLDEPFSNLDVRLRVEMREEVRKILKRAGVTAISVTHDQEEALSISDRVAIMNDGTIEQVGDPAEVFENPESRFVASFLGQASFLSARVAGDDIETGMGTFRTARLNGPVEAYNGATVDVLVRPDDLRAIPTAESTADGYVTQRQYNGPSFVYRVTLHSGDVVHCLHNHSESFEPGEPVEIDLTADHPLAWYPTE
ncbi:MULTISPECIES: ABC transporter ATP-binding protein [Halomicrobium]|uniref:Molybdate/tungstate import ATP-binding protein WtpC n=2 Tax=Halomicrobium mukohataei TaxID=57705 RepID=C7NXF3_HALMD|nr:MULTISPECIES: ABC transporter ATP-binding protein [Halomicrobium]ACV48387.1 ABC transporter related [Halomicrobium mukohataei DSM 12286]QCD66798.1 ABC transporter ATP-binding protein [Halomicrobium mukohataei]QFR21607.1 ATP-binding cassette domain-containing protein [Halomicrobium sp. ZPS1]